MVSNEWCLAKSNPRLNPGGITIYDINDPTNPVRLVQAFGDFDLHGNRANEAHSAIAWDAGDNAYVAAIDNEDVDLVDITNPAAPELIAETELPGVHVDGHGALKTSHDFDVLQFPDDSWHLMVSDWDAGWVDVDVTDPSNPTIVGETDYPECDQVVPTACPPAGNAHQGEWNSDGSVLVGTDEDFDSYRTSPLTRTTGPGAPDEYTTVAVGGAPVTILPDKALNGPVAFGGYGCPGTSAPIPDADTTIPPESLASGEEQIIVLQRGPGAGAEADPNNPEAACFPGEKADNATDQGWDAVIVTGRHTTGGAAADDPPNCGFASERSPRTSRSSPCAPRTPPCTSCSAERRTSRSRTPRAIRPTWSPTSGRSVRTWPSPRRSTDGATRGCSTPRSRPPPPRSVRSPSRRPPTRTSRSASGI